MLFRVTQQHDKDISNLAQALSDITEFMKILAEYNPSLVMMEIDEQLEGYKDRVTKVTNTIQQLNHRLLAVDLLTPEQMNIMHMEVEKVAEYEELNNLAQKTSDYYQIEVTYTRTEDDIVIIVHVPCIKIKQLFTSYRHLSFPIPIPVAPLANDLTIGQVFNIQNFKTINESALDKIFDDQLNCGNNCIHT